MPATFRRRLLVLLGLLAFNTLAGADVDIPTGACCAEEPSSGTLLCHQVQAPVCDSLGGYYYGDGTTCTDAFVECPSASDEAACCVEDADLGWYCVDLSLDDCHAQSGVWYGLGVICGDPGINCDPLTEDGACCYEEPDIGLVCVVMSDAHCADIGGFWYGAGSTCADPFVECEPLEGACCYVDSLGNLVCDEFEAYKCEDVGGTWYAGLNCSNPMVECDPIDGCVAVEGSECAGRPSYNDQDYLAFGNGEVAVETASPNIFGDRVITVFDLSSVGAMALNTNLPVGRYSHPTWTEDNLGSILGLAMDEVGNIFVTTTRTWNVDVVGPAGWGAVYRIDHITGAITTFAVLSNAGSGLGSITFDCDHQQFFVTNFEDGLIYRLDAATGGVLGTFDHGTPYNNMPGPVALGDRPWAVEVNGHRLYYSLWNEDIANVSSSMDNEIWSIELDPAGGFVAGTDQHEITVPEFFIEPANCSSPVSDLDFSPTGTMLLAERSQNGFDAVGAHDSRVLEYECDGTMWVPTSATFTAGFAPGSCAGGVDAKASTVWASADAMHIGSGDNIYGFQGMPATGGNVADSWLIDYNGNLVFQDKTMLGDLVVTGSEGDGPPSVDCPDIQILDIDCINMLSPWEYDIRLGFSNMDTAANLTSVHLTPAGAATLTPDTFAMNVPPLHSWGVDTLLEGANPGTTMCIDVEMTFSNGATCTEAICVELPWCIIWVPGDFDFDGAVDVNDLISLLERWGDTCQEDDCQGHDLDESGLVDTGDLLIVLDNWGS